VRAVSEPGVRGLTDLKMVSPDKGFVVGQGVIFGTDDGRRWIEQYSDDASWFLSVEAVDADHAWAVAQNGLLATDDGGRQWMPVGQPPGTALRSVDFVDPSTGWGTDGKHVYRSLDGGRSWSVADPPCGAERVCFAGREDGWAARDTHVFRTVDGGQTWTTAFELPVEAPNNEFDPRSIFIHDLECAGPGSAWVLFAGPAAGSKRVPYVVYRGVAGGSWTPVLKTPGGSPPAATSPEGGPYPAPLAAVDRSSVVYAAFTPSSIASVAMAVASDGGRVLQPWRPVPDLFNVTSLSFPTTSTGWATGTKAGATNVDAVVMTADGGRTWHEQLTRPVEPPGQS
jgi:photosystem II stability/assembly factor-like uncharacterized protein